MTAHASVRRAPIAASASPRRWLVAAGFTLASGCSGGQEAALITLTGPVTPTVTRIELLLASGPQSNIVRVPEMDGPVFVFPKTVSVTYTSGIGAMLSVDAKGYSGQSVVLTGMGSAGVVSHGLTPVFVDLSPPMADRGPPDMLSPPGDMASRIDM